MKTSLIGILIAVSSFGAIAKGSSHVKKDDAMGNSSVACMIQVDDASASRFINVNYIRAVEIVRADKYEEANPRVVTIRMASNYAAKSSYSIMYPTEDAAKQALKDFAMKINNCEDQ